jgi:hypothetical protein
MKQYAAKENITIGNGLGQHRFTKQASYTEKALRAACLTAVQIAMYFTTDKKSVK